MKDLVYYSAKFNEIVVLEYDDSFGYYYETWEFYLKISKDRLADIVKEFFDEEYEVIGEL